MSVSSLSLPRQSIILQLVVLCAFILLNGDGVVEAFQTLATRRGCSFGTLETKDSVFRIPVEVKSGQRIDQPRLSLASNGSDDDDNRLETRLKTTIRFESSSSDSNIELMEAGNKPVIQPLKNYVVHPFTYLKNYFAGDKLRGLNGYNESEADGKSVIERVKLYVKYSFTYLKNYLAGEKQDEVDGFNDIIVSDKTFEEFTASTNTNAGDELDALASACTKSADIDSFGSTPHLKLESSFDVVTTSTDTLNADRWAVSAKDVNLSGKWNIISTSTEDFQKEYDRYLMLLGQPFIVRSVALSIVKMTTEETIQSEEGRSLLVRGTNARGVWERTLTASGADETNSVFTPVRTPILTIDKERVEAEAWWENDGTVHRSWLRGVTKYGGGDFESKRYLEENGKVLTCESTFHPNDMTRDKAMITWRFLREGETL